MPQTLPIKSLLSSKKLRAIGSAVAAFLGYGGWAYYANHTHEFSVSLKAALTQGSYSFVLTLSLAWLMEVMFKRINALSLKAPITFITTCLFLYGTSWSINALLGTPEILMTILPGAIIGSIYTFSYTLALSKLHQANLSLN